MFGSWFGDPRYVIVRRQGNVTTVEKGANQPVNVMTNRYATAGTTIKTGRNSVVQIGTLGGGSVLVGPNITVRLTPTGFDILEQSGGGFTVAHPPGGEYRVRTDCPVLSARG